MKGSTVIKLLKKISRVTAEYPAALRDARRDVFVVQVKIKTGNSPKLPVGS